MCSWMKLHAIILHLMSFWKFLKGIHITSVWYGLAGLMLGHRVGTGSVMVTRHQPVTPITTHHIQTLPPHHCATTLNNAKDTNTRTQGGREGGSARTCGWA